MSCKNCSVDVEDSYGEGCCRNEIKERFTVDKWAVASSVATDSADVAAGAAATIATVETYLLEEQIRRRLQEEELRNYAERNVIEAEEQQQNALMEKAIVAEMERLRKRTKSQILEEMIYELSAKVEKLQLKETLLEKRCFRYRVKSDIIKDKISRLSSQLVLYKTKGD